MNPSKKQVITQVIAKETIFNDNSSKIYYALNPSDKIEHALIVVSPFNGYFTSQNMEILFRWAKDNCNSFDVFTMDKVSKYNLIALGSLKLEPLTSLILARRRA